MGRGVAGSVVGSEASRVGSRVGRVSSRCGTIIEWRSGTRVERSLHVGQGLGSVSRSDLTIEWSKAWVVEVGRYAKTVRGGVGGDIA